jgi:hypothetical protein
VCVCVCVFVLCVVCCVCVLRVVCGISCLTTLSMVAYDIDAAGTIRYHPGISLMSGGIDSLVGVTFNCVVAKKRAVSTLTVTFVISSAPFGTE